MLRLQHRAGLSTHYLYKFRRGQGVTHPADTKICSGDCRRIRTDLDGSRPACAKPVRPDFYGADTGNPLHSPENLPELRHFLSAAALQYFFDLLFSGADETVHLLCHLCGQRRNSERHSDLPAAGFGRGKCHLVLHALNRTGRRRICHCHDRKTYPAATRPGIKSKTTWKYPKPGRQDICAAASCLPGFYTSQIEFILSTEAKSHYSLPQTSSSRPVTAACC